MSSTVAIINWNSGPRLRTCIESLLGTTTKAEILVVDNASEDDSMEMVHGFRSRVNSITNNVNRGFAAAINQAFQSRSMDGGRAHDGRPNEQRYGKDVAGYVVGMNADEAARAALIQPARTAA